MFQSLTGSIHTESKLAPILSVMTFQSLTGSIHTQFFYCKVHLHNPVSIPHRFNSHIDILGLDIFKFCWFQSLTGSIHTAVEIKSVDRFTLFQSLTGSIHTPYRTRGWSRRVLVSIPHRFNSHFSLLVLLLKLYFLFQSLTGSIHTNLKADMNFIFKEFQSLTGSIHTWDTTWRIWRASSVSIPHRFNSHWLIS